MHTRVRHMKIYMRGKKMKNDCSDSINEIEDSATRVNVYLNLDNDFFLCPASFLSPCAPAMPNKSTYIYKDFFFFVLHSFFYIGRLLLFCLCLSLSPFRYSSSMKENNRKNEKERNRETTSLPTHHITLHIHKNLILRSLSFL